MKLINVLNLNKKRAVIAGVVALILSLSLVLGYQTENYSTVTFSAGAVLAFIGVLVLSFCLVVILYFGLDKLAVSVPAPKCERVRFPREFLISFIALFILFSISFVALYPGLFVFDAAWQLSMFREHTISEHQPVLHTVLLGAIVGIIKNEAHANKGVALYSIFQYTLSALALAYSAAYLFKRTKRYFVWIFSILFFGCFTPIVLQVLSATKDTLFLLAVLMMFTLCLELFDRSGEGIEIVKEGKADPSGIAKVALFIFCTALAAIFRNNCIYALPFFFIPLFIFLKGKRKIAAIIAAGTVILFAAYKLFFVPAFLDEKVDGREFYPVPAQQLARIYLDEDADITADEKALIEKVIDKEAIENYQPKIADKVKSGLDMEYYKSHKKQVQKLYLDLIKKNPGTAFDAFLELSCGMWYPGCRLTLFNDGRYGYWVIGCYPPAVFKPHIDILYKYYALFADSYFVTQNPITSLFFAPGTFFFIFAIMFGYAIDRSRREFLTFFIFIFMLWCTYLLGPLAMVRYSVYLYGMVPFYLLVIRRQS